MEANGGHSPLLQVKARPRGRRKDEVSIWIRETEKRRTVSTPDTDVLLQADLPVSERVGRVNQR